MRRFGCAWLVAFVLVSGCKHSDEGVRLRFNYASGEEYVYEMHDAVQSEYSAEIISPGVNDTEAKEGICSKSQQQIIVMSVCDAGDGLYRLQVAYEVVSDSVGADDTCKKEYHEKRKKRILGKLWQYTLQMRNNGEVVAVEGENEEETRRYQRNYISRQPIFPDSKIHPGFKWKHTINLKIPDNDPIPVVIKYRFSRYDTINGYACVVIEYWSAFEKTTDMTGTRWNKEKFKQYIVHNTTNSTGKLYFAIKKGVMVQTESKISQTFAWDVIRSDGIAETGSSEMTDMETVMLKSIKRDSTSTLSKL